MTRQQKARVRLTIYIVSSLGSVAMGYLVAKGWAGDAETSLWAGIVAVVNGLAALNTDTSDPEGPPVG